MLSFLLISALLARAADVSAPVVDVPVQMPQDEALPGLPPVAAADAGVPALPAPLPALAPASVSAAAVPVSAPAQAAPTASTQLRALGARGASTSESGPEPGSGLAAFDGGKSRLMASLEDRALKTVPDERLRGAVTSMLDELRAVNKDYYEQTVMRLSGMNGGDWSKLGRLWEAQTGTGLRGVSAAERARVLFKEGEISPRWLYEPRPGPFTTVDAREFVERVADLGSPAGYVDGRYIFSELDRMRLGYAKARDYGHVGGKEIEGLARVLVQGRIARLYVDRNMVPASDAVAFAARAIGDKQDLDQGFRDGLDALLFRYYSGAPRRP